MESSSWKVSFYDLIEILLGLDVRNVAAEKSSSWHSLSVAACVFAHEVRAFSNTEPSNDKFVVTQQTLALLVKRWVRRYRLATNRRRSL